MNLDQMKSDWQHTVSSQKDQTELWRMTKINNHPQLKRLRIKLILEMTFLTLFLIVYYDFFDGAQKPMWLNILLICASLIFVLNDLWGWFALRNPIQQNQLVQSLAALEQTLKRLRTSSLLASFIFSASIIIFFSSVIHFSTAKYIILAAMIINMLVFLYWSAVNWQKRIDQIKKAINTFQTNT